MVDIIRDAPSRHDGGTIKSESRLWLVGDMNVSRLHLERRLDIWVAEIGYGGHGEAFLLKQRVRAEEGKVACTREALDRRAGKTCRTMGTGSSLGYCSPVEIVSAQPIVSLRIDRSDVRSICGDPLGVGSSAHAGTRCIHSICTQRCVPAHIILRAALIIGCASPDKSSADSEIKDASTLEDEEQHEWFLIDHRNFPSGCSETTKTNGRRLIDPAHTSIWCHRGFRKGAVGPVDVTS
ncbi:hypothetical protein B0H13DRAFT_1863395 [Mycena leptocephala]|nr:hypothetical protein B0H13DRAFT_1863395 [Mycena leptocephala]